MTERLGKNRQMQHLNGNLLCAIDVETTGLIAGHHDIVQVCILPLDHDIRPLTALDDGTPLMPFYMDIKPKFPEHADPSAMRVNKLRLADLILKGIDPFEAAEKFEDWFEKLKLATGKKIAPLGQNYCFDRGFIQEWLGPDSYMDFFDYHIRDTSASALLLNDRSHFRVEPCPFPKVNLRYLASQLEIPCERAHDSLQDCLITAQIYRRMCQF